MQRKKESVMVAKRGRKTLKEKGREVIRKQAGEPEFATPLVDNDVRLMKAYNWYHTNVDHKKSIEWLVVYLTDKQLAARIAAADEWKVPAQLGFIARLALRGIELPEKTKRWFNKQLNEVKARLQPEVTTTVPVVKVKSVREKMVDQADAVIACIEVELDEMIKTNARPIDVRDLLRRNNVTFKVAKIIVEEFKPRMQEVAAAAFGKDPIAVEAYRGYSAKLLQKLAAFLATIVSACDKLEEPKERKPRQIKARKFDPVKALAKFKFKKKSDNGFVSIDPLNIHGARRLWIFNTKYNKLSVLVAREGEKLSVAGSSVTGMDDTKSKTRTVRKPLEMFSKTSQGENQLAAFFASQKTTLGEARSRINEDTVLLFATR